MSASSPCAKPELAVTRFDLIGLLLVHFVLTALPLAAGALVAARLGLTRLPVLLALAVAVSGCTAMLAFWAFLLSHNAGLLAMYLIVTCSAAACGWALRRAPDPATATW